MDFPRWAKTKFDINNLPTGGNPNQPIVYPALRSEAIQVYIGSYMSYFISQSPLHRDEKKQKPVENHYLTAVEQLFDSCRIAVRQLSNSCSTTVE
jgi:hypothetical protein